MTTPLWQPGHVYLPGDLVQPIQAAVAISTAITNPGFESGSTDWTLGAGAAVTTGTPYAGTKSLEFTGTGGLTETIHASVPVDPGRSITASCMYFQGGASAGNNGGAVFLRWLDASDVVISTSVGNVVNSASFGTWKASTVTAVAPALAAKVSIGIAVTRTNWNVSAADNFAWNYYTPPIPAGLIYKAVQPASGISDNVEPVWPTTLGVQVIDNTVTWEAVTASRVVWQAVPLLKSCPVEPTWPLEDGAMVADCFMSWKTRTRIIKDPNCPHTKAVAILSGKVFAVDEDIVKFCATANPLDWSAENDAGFLPTGLQQANANHMAVLAPYRSNLCPFNASSFQNWQVDPDPAQMAILDHMDGIGSVWQQAARNVGNELFFLSQLGVRSIGIAVGADNLAAGDVGTPIDSLVIAALVEAIAAAEEPIATYYPGGGQYWLSFRPDHPKIVALGGPLPDTCNDVDYSQDISISGGTAPYSNAQVVAGDSPDGMTLTIDGTTLTIAFSDAAAANYSFWVTVDDANGLASLPFNVAFIVHDFEVTGTLPDTVEGEDYDETVALTDGEADYVAEITSGALPDDGEMTVVGDSLRFTWPDTVDAGTYTFGGTVTDATGCVALFEFTVNVANTGVACGVETEYEGGQAFPNLQLITLGSGLGEVELEYATGMNPDKFELWFDGVKVIDTGYHGKGAEPYIGGGTFQSALTAYLLAHSLPDETIVEIPGPAVDAPTQWASVTDRETVSFTKTTTTTTALLKVYSPLTGTLWIGNVGCPVAPP